MWYSAPGGRPMTLDTMIIKTAFCFSTQIETSESCLGANNYHKEKGWPQFEAKRISFFVYCWYTLEVGAQGLCGVWQIRSCSAANYQLVEISEPIFSNVVIAYSSKSAREANLLCPSYCWHSLKGNHLQKKKKKALCKWLCSYKCCSCDSQGSLRPPLILTLRKYQLFSFLFFRKAVCLSCMWNWGWNSRV